MKYKYHLVEIGVERQISLEEFWNSDVLLEVFEPSPKNRAKIHDLYGSPPNLIVHPYAIWKESCKLRFYERGSLSYVEGLKSPATERFGYVPEEKDVIEVEARTFDEFDDGSIDILDIDAEGAEWYALEKMVSRPKFIIVETDKDIYVNPFLSEIEAWMTENGYQAFAKEDANTFYKRQ